LRTVAGGGIIPSTAHHGADPKPRTMITCTLAWIAALLTIPLVILLWLSESKQQRARRWRRTGSTYRSISERLGVSQSTARRWCMA